MKGYQFTEAVEQAAHKVCSALGLQPVVIEWSPSVPTACINTGGLMKLKDVAADADVHRSMLDRYVGFVVHELLHRKFTSFAVRDGRPYVDRLHNAVEDVWIERQGIKAGLTGNITGLLTTLINDMVAEAMTQKIDWTDPAQYPFALAVEGRRYANKVPLAKGLAPIFAEASKRIDSCLNSSDTLEVARWVFAQLQTPPSDQADEAGEAGDEAGDEDGDEAGDDQDGTGSSDGQDEGEGAGEPGEAAGEGSEAAGEAGDEAGDQAGDQVGDRKPVTGFQPAVQVEPSCPDAGPDAGGGSYCRDKAGYAWDAFPRGNVKFQATSMSGGKLRYEVKRLFDNTARSDWAVNRKAGALNVRALPSLATGSDRVFKRRDEQDGIDSAVLILLDNSSSMFEETYSPALMRQAVPTVVALHQAVRAAGAEVMVCAFGRNVSRACDWGTPTAKAAAVLSEIGSAGMTNDAQAIRFCGDILLKRSEDRRILFVLTDGNGDFDQARANVDALERLGVTVIGVGIGLDVSGVYPNNIRVDSADDLASASFKQIKMAV